jgi:transcriptional regulator with XRE-family HTH domain
MLGPRVEGHAGVFGERLRGWRLVLGLTAAQVAERSSISRATLRKIETGDAGVSFESVLRVSRALGVLDQLVDSVDPLNSDLGRARAGELNRKRAR